MNNIFPLISVIVPIYKVEDYMDECVTSILAQTYSNLEIILVDDGSPDSCPQKCDVLAKKDARIRVIHKENGGLSSARNAGVKIATGQYISFVDSDDVIEEHMYEVLIKGFSMTNNVAITSIRMKRYINGTLSDFNKQWVFDSPRIIKGKDYAQMILELSCSNSVCDKLYRANLCRKVTFMEGRNNEDTFFNYLIGKELKVENAIVVVMPFSAYYYRMRQDSICTSKNKPLIFDVLKNLDDILADTSPDDLKFAGLIKRVRIRTIYSFLESITLNKEWKPLYYNQFREILTQFKYTEMKHALRLNDLCYALMHMYCPWMRTSMRKVLQNLGRYSKA